MTDNQDLQALLERGIALARTGQKDEARLLFETVIRADQFNEQAWLWMAAVARTTPERREALEIVLEINPENQQAREALNRLGGPRARRKADEARAIAERIGTEDAIAEADFQPVIERPAPEPETPPEPEPTPEEKETALARTLIETARAERAEAEPGAAADASSAEAAEEGTTGPVVEVIDVERARQQRQARLLGAIAIVLVALIAFALALPALETAISGGPTPTDSFLTQIARLNTPTATFSDAVIVTALPPRPGQVPPTWTPSPTPTITQTPTASATPPPPGSYALVFSRRVPEATGYALYTARGDGSAVTRLTAGAGDDRHPAPGPDRLRLVFVTELDGKRQLAFLALGERTPAPTATEGTPASEPAEATPQVAAPDRETSEALTSITATAISAPSWSPDGYRIVFSANIAGNEELYVTDVDRASFVRLTDNDVIDRDPAWSPDGQWIVFASERGGRGQLELYRMRPNGADVTQLTNSQGSSIAPAWRPDGRQIVFVSDRDRDADLYVMNADGTNEQLLTRNDSAEDRDPAWSPDGRWIAFSSNRDSANFRLFLLDPFVGTVLPVTRGDADDLEAAWLLELPSR